MIDEEKIRHLKNDVLTKDWEEAKDAAFSLVDFGKDLSLTQRKEVVDFFVNALENDNRSVMNIAAITFRHMGANFAVQPLLSNILKEDNKNYNGTLVYAIQQLDCSKKIKEIFQILFYHGYEARMNAYEILRDQEFEFTRQELLDIKAMWEDLKLNPEKGDYNDENVTMIDQAVNWYISYLD